VVWQNYGSCILFYFLCVGFVSLAFAGNDVADGVLQDFGDNFLD
jgi:hypothetical protein